MDPKRDFEKNFTFGICCILTCLLLLLLVLLGDVVTGALGGGAMGLFEVPLTPNAMAEAA